MKLTVAILTFNSATNLPDLLETIQPGLAGVPDWELVISDSGSTDETIDVAHEMVPWATVIALSENRGFAATANAAFAASSPDSDAMLILSPTVRLREGCVRHMLTAMGRIGTGIVVPRLLRADGTAWHSLRRRPTLLRAYGDVFLGSRIAARLGLSELVRDPEAYEADVHADWATGAVTMVSRDCMLKTGRMDESFFLYSEETEFELRAADHGFPLVFAPQAEAVHIGGISKVRPELWALTCANKVRLYGMRHGRLPTWGFWIAVVAGEVIRMPIGRSNTRRAAIGKLLDERSAIVRGQPAKHPYRPSLTSR